MILVSVMSNDKGWLNKKVFLDEARIARARCCYGMSCGYRRYMFCVRSDPGMGFSRSC